MNCIVIIVVVSLYFISTLIFDVCGENDRFCEHEIRKDIPIVYLTLNPISTVSWLGTITHRQLVMNWKWPTSGDNNNQRNVNTTGLNSDWIGLFNIKVSNGINVEGKKYGNYFDTY